MKPWPLQAFWPLQALLALLQALWPLQALAPTHFTPAANDVVAKVRGREDGGGGGDQRTLVHGVASWIGAGESGPP